MELTTDSNNYDYDTCDECKTFRAKKWKLCAKCGTTIEYFEETRKKLNMKLEEVIPINESVIFFRYLIIDVSNIKLGHIHGKTTNISSLTDVGKIGIHSQHNGFLFKETASYLRQKYLKEFFRFMEIHCDFIEPVYDLEEWDDKGLYVELIANSGHTNSIFNMLRDESFQKKKTHDIKKYTFEYIIKKLVKSRISDPLCINFDDNSDMVRVQKMNEQTCGLIIKELNNSAISNWKGFTRDNFKFLDDIKCTLYYSDQHDILFTYDELKQYFDVEFKMYDIKINEYSELFMLRNIRIRILNEKFERLFYFADLRNKTTKHLPNDFKLKEEHKEHHLLTLLYLLGFEKC